MHFLDCSKQPSNVNLVLRELFRDGYRGLPRSSSNFQVRKNMQITDHIKNGILYYRWPIRPMRLMSWLKCLYPHVLKKKSTDVGLLHFFFYLQPCMNHWRKYLLFIFKWTKKKRSQSDISIFILKVWFFFYICS